MAEYKPPLPPAVIARLPDDPFDQWLAVQAGLGHDRHWLNHNRVMLKERWERDRLANLPPPERSLSEPKIGDRYDEL